MMFDTTVPNVISIYTCTQKHNQRTILFWKLVNRFSENLLTSKTVYISEDPTGLLTLLLWKITSNWLWLCYVV